MGKVDWKWLIIGGIIGWFLSAFTCHKSYPGTYPTMTSALIT